MLVFATISGAAAGILEAWLLTLFTRAGPGGKVLVLALKWSVWGLLMMGFAWYSRLAAVLATLSAGACMTFFAIRQTWKGGDDHAGN